MFNQTIATTTNFDNSDNPIGYSVEVKTFEYLNLVVLIFLFSIPFILIKYFRKF